MSKIKLTEIDSEFLDAAPITEGQLIFAKNEDTSVSVYVDIDSTHRLPVCTGDMHISIYDPEKRYEPGNKVVFSGSSWMCRKACKGIVPPAIVGLDATVAALTHHASQVWADNDYGTPATAADIEPLLTDEVIVALNLRKPGGVDTYTATAEDRTALAQMVCDAEQAAWIDGHINSFVDVTWYYIELTWKELQYYILNKPGMDADDNISDFGWIIESQYWLQIAASGLAATVRIGNVTTGVAGSTATVTNTGTFSDAVLNFQIPRGATGTVVINQKAGTLSSSKWSSTSPYTQTLTVSGLSAGQNGDIGIATTATSAQREAARYANLSITGQAQNQLTITADGEKPTVDIPVVVTLLG